MGLPALTDRQRALLDHLTSFVAKRGYAPSLQEIAHAFGFSSLQGGEPERVRDLLKRRGVSPFRHEGGEVVQQGPLAVCQSRETHEKKVLYLYTVSQV